MWNFLRLANLIQNIQNIQKKAKTKTKTNKQKKQTRECGQQVLDPSHFSVSVTGRHVTATI